MSQRFLFLLACIVSGAIWGTLGAVLGAGESAFGSLVIGGVWFSPIIGLLIGLSSRPIYRKRSWLLIPWSLITLYLAVALFGFGVGLYDALRPIPNRIPSAVMLQAILASIAGITILHFVWILWPLAWFNHVVLRAMHNWIEKKSGQEKKTGLTGSVENP